MNSNFKNKLYMATVIALVLATAAGLAIIAGCTKTLDGDVDANQKPIVYFVNIPPEGQQFSRNPVIHWVGTDRDGLIDFFRYHVATTQEIGAMAPADYAASLTEDEWVRLDVEPKGPDPQTSNVVSMSADLSDPVRTYIDQYIFLQAFDEEGLGSDIVFRIYSRNDNPPNTQMYGIAPADLPFINSVRAGGIITGVKVRWYGEDPVDYPADPPPFEFHWRLYGPYSDAEMAEIRSEYFDQVYVTTDGLVYEMGDTIIRCDTIFTDTDFEEDCDTLVVETGMQESAYGRLENRFNIGSEDFVADGLDKIAVESNNGGTGANSVWVLDQADTLYNVFRNRQVSAEADTTVLMNFVFWVRSRDDATVPDLVPSYKEFQVIDPRYERDIAVLEFNTTAGPQMWNPPIVNQDYSKKKYWSEVIEGWAQTRGYNDLEFDTVRATSGILAASFSAPDYFLVKRMYDNTPDIGLPISELLKHKMLIMYNDDIAAPNASFFSNVYKAIDAGINVWVTMRTPIFGNGSAEPDLELIPPSQYTWYFGVERTAFSGWVCMAMVGILPVNCDVGGLFQDFIGGISLQPDPWPELNIDPDRLRDRYRWITVGQDLYSEEANALPEVNWSQTAYGTEVLYLYKSSYGQSHPLDAKMAFQGRPVAHRYETVLFRTVHFNFTTLAMEETAMDSVAHMVLDWLYDPDMGAGTATSLKHRYPDAPVTITMDQARENAREREEEINALEGFTIEEPNRR